MATTPERIREYLKNHPAASAIEISRVLRLTIPNIRHHLHAMLADGWVEVSGRVAPQGKGRPTTLYSLSHSLQEDNLGKLSSALLDEILDNLTDQARKDRLSSLARRLAGPAADLPGKMPQRLNSAVRLLNSMHYQAHWEARSTGPQIFLGKCPYSEILAQHPELCQLDEFLIGHLVGAEVKQIARQDLRHHRVAYCVFCGR